MTHASTPHVVDRTPESQELPSGREFDALLTPLLPTAYRAAIYLTRNQADAEDVVQDAVLLALRGFDGFQPGTNFKAWFMRILTNVFYARGRTPSRHSSASWKPSRCGRPYRHSRWNIGRSPRCTSWRTFRIRRSPTSSTARWAQCGRACTARDGSSRGPFGHSQRTTELWTSPELTPRLSAPATASDR